MNLSRFIDKEGLPAVQGRTVEYRGTFWRVIATEPDIIVGLTGADADTQGHLYAGIWDRCRLYPTFEEVAGRYPRLIRAMVTVCALSESEAVNAVHGLITTGRWYAGCEVVARIGGAARTVRHAFASRHSLSHIH